MDKYMLGFQLLVIGMGTVIISLCLLSLFLRLSGRYLGGDSDKQEIKKTGENNMKQTKNIENDKSENSEIDSKKAAAIAAAVYQCLENDKEYRILSIKKSRNWKR